MTWSGRERNPASGGHLAYIPGGGIYHAALGDYLAAVSNKYAGIFFTGPGAVRMENMLIRWVADLVGLSRDRRRQHRLGREHRQPGGDRDGPRCPRAQRAPTSPRRWSI